MRQKGRTSQEGRGCSAQFAAEQGQKEGCELALCDSEMSDTVKVLNTFVLTQALILRNPLEDKSGWTIVSMNDRCSCVMLSTCVKYHSG